MDASEAIIFKQGECKEEWQQSKVYSCYGIGKYSPDYGHLNSA